MPSDSINISSGLISTVLILGPMKPTRGGRIETEAPTKTLRDLVERMTDEIKERANYRGPDIRVRSPEDNLAQTIIPGIFELIESADLVIFDLSGSRPNVTYEIGLIHALGLPTIFITKDVRPAFYFQSDRYIGRFDRRADFDRTHRGHAALFDRLVEFYTSEGSAAEFARNQVSSFFDDLPIVDISGASGIAAGYWANSIRRFVRSGGYFDVPPHTVSWRGQGQSAAGGSAEFEIRHFIAIRPPSGLMQSRTQDDGTLSARLDDLGFNLMDASIEGRDTQDLRNYGAKFLVRKAANGGSKPSDLGVVMEIPSTLYALQYAPRILRIDAQLRTTPVRQELLERLKRARFQDMIERFHRLMRFYLNHPAREAEVGVRKFRFVTLDQLPNTLRETGVLPT
jgi:hypothetical protein